MPSRPRLDQAVLLEQDGGTWLRAIVRGYDNADAVLQPHAGAVAAVPGEAVPGEAAMTWTSDAGLFWSPVRLTRRQPGSWQAHFSGRTERLQRRGSLRVPMGTPMTLTRSERTYEGVLVDVSDVALRARFDADHTPAMREGNDVETTFALGMSGFMLRGGVLREQPTQSPHFVDVVVALLVDGTDAGDLSSALATEQREWQRTDR